MMVGRVLSHVARELSNLDFPLQFALKASEQNLSLTRFQSIAETGNRTGTVSD
jgi:hypothetical protein